jgi:hypothetical protein
VAGVSEEASFFLQVGLLVGWGGGDTIYMLEDFSPSCLEARFFSPSRIVGWVGGGDTIC